MLWYRLALTLCAIYFWITHHRVFASLRENLPKGPAILCPNHTSLRDPIYVALAVGMHERIYFMAKRELFDVFIVGSVLRSLGAYPVKRGEPDVDAIRRSLALLKDGSKIVVFPEGRRVSKGVDAEAKAGAAFLAAKSGAPLVPVCIKNGRASFSYVYVSFGEPVAVEGKRDAQRDAAAQVMQSIEVMKVG